MKHLDPLAKQTYTIIGACMEVHRVLGNGYSEPVYQEAASIEFERRRIPYNREVELYIEYKGVQLKKRYYADYICYSDIIVEFKAVSCLLDEHISQVLNYLKSSGHHLGLLINFGTSSLTFKRIIL